MRSSWRAEPAAGITASRVSRTALAWRGVIAGVRSTPRGVIHHSDHGCQSTSLLFGERCQAVGIRCSMGRVGDCYHNAMAERCFATLECELLARHPFQTQREARTALFESFDVFSNRQWWHSALDYLSPDTSARRWATQTSVVA